MVTAKELGTLIRNHRRVVTETETTGSSKRGTSLNTINSLDTQITTSRRIGMLKKVI